MQPVLGIYSLLSRPIFRQNKRLPLGSLGETRRKLAFEHIAVFLIEFVHTAGAIHDFLFTSVERMALRANFNVEFGFAHGRFSGEFVTARAGNINFMVVGMNFRFHGFSF